MSFQEFRLIALMMLALFSLQACQRLGSGEQASFWVDESGRIHEVQQPEKADGSPSSAKDGDEPVANMDESAASKPIAVISPEKPLPENKQAENESSRNNRNSGGDKVESPVAHSSLSDSSAELLASDPSPSGFANDDFSTYVDADALSSQGFQREGDERFYTWTDEFGVVHNDPVINEGGMLAPAMKADSLEADETNEIDKDKSFFETASPEGYPDWWKSEAAPKNAFKLQIGRFNTYTLSQTLECVRLTWPAYEDAVLSKVLVFGASDFSRWFVELSGADGKRQMIPDSRFWQVEKSWRMEAHWRTESIIKPGLSQAMFCVNNPDAIHPVKISFYLEPIDTN